MSDSVRSQRWQPTRLPRPWDSPGKNTGVGCHFLLQCIKVKSESEVAQSFRLLATPWTAAHQSPPSMGFSRQEYWSGLPLPSPIISTNPHQLNTFNFINRSLFSTFIMIRGQFYYCVLIFRVSVFNQHRVSEMFASVTSRAWPSPCCFCSVAQSCPTLYDLMDCSTSGFPVLYHLSELTQLMSIESVISSNHLILFYPVLLPSVFPSIRVFFNESALHIRWPKYWNFSLRISPSNEYSRLISFRIDWFDRLTVQRTLKSLLQHHSSKASILWHSAFFRVQLSYLYMTTGKTIALTVWTFVGKVMSLLFNVLSRIFP